MIKKCNAIFTVKSPSYKCSVKFKCTLSIEITDKTARILNGYNDDFIKLATNKIIQPKTNLVKLCAILFSNKYTNGYDFFKEIYNDFELVIYEKWLENNKLNPNFHESKKFEDEENIYYVCNMERNKKLYTRRKIM